tara:strand:+ start:98 stop:580 length:483 start_codon:yes stop_codon:yes gene_type:complete
MFDYWKVLCDKVKTGGNPSAGILENTKMENLNNAPITENFMDALIAERDAFRVERDEMKAKLVRAERDAKLLEEQRGAWLAIMADPIREMVKKEFADMMSDFDIADYTDEIKEIAADGFDIGDYEDDIRDSIDFNASDYTTEIGDVVRDILRDSVIKLEV